MADRMTKTERDDLLRLIKQRERVSKAAAEARSASMLAEFERQVSATYAFDNDETWKAITEDAKRFVEAADQAIAARCRELGIPEQFRPGLTIGWYSRGESAMKERRDELRRVAKAEIAAIERAAVMEISAASITAQEEIYRSAVTTDAARAFLDKLPSVESLMLPLRVEDMVRKLNAKRADRMLPLGDVVLPQIDGGNVDDDTEPY